MLKDAQFEVFINETCGLQKNIIKKKTYEELLRYNA